MCIIDCLSTIVFILPLHLDYTKVIILILWWRNFQLEYWRTFQLVSTIMIHLFMRKILDSVVAGCCLAAAFCLVSCDSDLDIQQEYPFTVEAMPVADEIAAGNKVEIRLEIVPEGDFSGTVYTLRYFQPEGKGRLKMEDGTVLKPNDRYLLGEKRFRLYYTSESADGAQTIDLYFENNWGSLQQLTFDFNAENGGENSGEEDAE